MDLLRNKDDMYNVSIIMPSLNVIDYIEECLDSVTNQTLRNIEIICVDAGSTDGTLEIIREYAKKDARIRIIVSDKKSYGYQLNIGIDAAKGEYIGIVETDDFVDLNMFKDLYEMAKYHDVDIVKSDFCRFTGKRPYIKEHLEVLTEDKTMYNRVINVRRTHKCFDLVMNTWTGIYRRAFLSEYEIRHNESKGAAYQDNGFWFLTFMYADTAYFVNKSYYKNRRDNISSSVYDTGGLIRIFGEHKYIWEQIKKNRLTFYEYRFVFTRKAILIEIAFLDKISEQWKMEYIMEMSSWLRQLRSDNAIDLWMFNEQDRNTILGIMNNPNEYFESISEKQNALESTLKDNTVIIYGAGAIGRRLYKHLTFRPNPIKIKCFAVSKKEAEYEGLSIPVLEIGELLNYKQEAVIVLAATDLYADDMKNNAEKLGFINIIRAYNDYVPRFEENKSIEEKEEYIRKWFKYISGEELIFNYPRDFRQYQQCYYCSVADIKRMIFEDRKKLKEWLGNRIDSKYIFKTLDIITSVEDCNILKYGKVYAVKSAGGNAKQLIDCSDPYYSEVKIKRILRSWLINKRSTIIKGDYNNLHTEYQILIEPYVERVWPLQKYVFLCFHGKIQFVLVETLTQRSSRYRDIFDAEFHHLPIRIMYNNYFECPSKPLFYSEMMNISEILSDREAFLAIHFIESDDGVWVDDVSLRIDGGLAPVEPQEWDSIFCMYMANRRQM